MARSMSVNSILPRLPARVCLTVFGPIRDEEDRIVSVLGLDIKFEDLAAAEEED
jgi:hypothetical protein